MSLRPNAFPLNQRGQYERVNFPECGLTCRQSYRSYGVNTYQRIVVGAICQDSLKHSIRVAPSGIVNIEVVQ